MGCRAVLTYVLCKLMLILLIVSNLHNPKLLALIGMTLKVMLQKMNGNLLYLMVWFVGIVVKTVNWLWLFQMIYNYVRIF